MQIYLRKMVILLKTHFDKRMGENCVKRNFLYWRNNDDHISMMKLNFYVIKFCMPIYKYAERYFWYIIDVYDWISGPK